MLDVNSLAPYHEVALRKPRLGQADLPWWLQGVFPKFSPGAMDEHCARVADQVNAGGFDVLLSGTCMQFAAPPIARHLGIPSVLYLGEPYRTLYEAPNIWRLPDRDATLKGAVKRAVDLVAVEHARRQVREEADSAAAFDSILVNSLFSAESVSRAYNLVGRVCYLGVDAQHWRVEHRPTDGVLVVGIGSIGPHKRVDFVIDALAAAAVPGCKLHWVGNESWPSYYAAGLEAQAEKLGVDLTLHVAITHAQMLEVLAEASLLAYAPRLEPFGYAPLECGAAGIPTVGVAEGGIRETVVDGYNGLLAARDPEDMGRAIRALATDDDLRRSLGANAQRCVDERWGLDAAVTRLEDELTRVLASPRTRRPA
jgi:glycosyltransferase involved in cell wall biosynthesis